MSDEVILDTRGIDAAVLDMDGVVTDTASLHEEAWKETFDKHLADLAEETGRQLEPFTHQDYINYVDGKPRYDGVRSFLRSRDLELPEHAVDGSRSVLSIGDEKDERFREVLETRGAQPLPGVVEFVSSLKEAGVRVAVISSSRNAQAVLDSAGVAHLFEERVDGVVSDELGLAGKPDPAIFLEAARRLEAEPDRTIVVEDALSGVEAGRSGGFCLVIGIARGGGEAQLKAHGADVAITSLEQITVLGLPEDLPRPAAEVPEMLPLWDALVRGMRRDTSLATFLDYDGTLTPIVERPEDARLDERMRNLVERLAESCFVAIVSGRDVSFVQEQVGLDTVAYLGSHGFDIVAPAGREVPGDALQRFEQSLPALDDAQEALERELADIDGAQVERKKFAVAVHYRRAAEDDVPAIEEAVRHEEARSADLHMTGGKKVFELRPALDWHKGRAVRWVLESFGLDVPHVEPVYIGDDVTDEDVFRELRQDGLTIAVTDDLGETSALFRVADTNEVREVLERICDLCESRMSSRRQA